MNESQFRGIVCRELKKHLPNYAVMEKQSLLYKLHIDAHGNIQPLSFASPTRGQLAFQTDILIKKGRVPLVVIETKFGRFSTHDVLTYSTKATKHKDVYPQLRYGLLVGQMSKISRKFFTHNSGFDFAVAMENVEDDLKGLVSVVQKQIQAAELVLDVLSERIEARKYSEHIELT